MSEPGILAAGRVEGDLGDGLSRSLRRRFAMSITVILLIAVVIDLSLPNTSDTVTAARLDHTSLSKTPHGFLALHETLSELGFEVDRHRATYGQLPDPATSVLLRLAPLPEDLVQDATHYDDSQTRLLREWIEAGGHLVTTSTATPMVRIEGFRFRSEAEQDFEPDKILEDAIDDPLQVRWDELERLASGTADLRGHRSELQNLDEGTSRLLSAYVSGGESPRVPFVDEPSDEWTIDVVNGENTLAVVRNFGHGKVWFVPSAAVFSNVGFGRMHTGPLAVALIHSASDEATRTLWFDEYAHGLDRDRGGWWYVSNGPLFYPVVAILIGLALLGWRGAVRLGAPRQIASSARRAVEEYIISLADLARRGGKYAGAAKHIDEAYRFRERVHEATHANFDLDPSQCRDLTTLTGFDEAARRAYRRRDPDTES